MNFISFVIYLKQNGKSDANVIVDSIHAYAAILHLISDINPSLGLSLHDKTNNQGMTLFMYTKDETTKCIRVSLIDKNCELLADLLVHVLGRKKVLLIGNREYSIEGIDLNHRDWGGKSSWDELLSLAPHREIIMEFVSPTAIMKSGDCGRYSYLLPDPNSIFLSIYQKWKHMDGKNFNFADSFPDFLNKGGCYVSELDVTTSIYETPDRTQKGFMGLVKYVIPGKLGDHARIINSLAQFAFYAGVGYQTSRGMGAVIVHGEN